mgnify:CR=1 FL=1
MVGSRGCAPLPAEKRAHGCRRLVERRLLGVAVLFSRFRLRRDLDFALCSLTKLPARVETGASLAASKPAAPVLHLSLDTPRKPELALLPIPITASKFKLLQATSVVRRSPLLPFQCANPQSAAVSSCRAVDPARRWLAKTCNLPPAPSKRSMWCTLAQTVHIPSG